MTKLEKTSHAFVIGVCILSAYLLVAPIIKRPIGRAHQTTSPLLGKRLDLADVRWSRRLNLVVALTTKCPFCAASLPFYQRLSLAVKSSESDVSLQVASPEPVDTTKTFLDEGGVQIPRILRASLKAMGVVGTPTLMVIDSGGTVKQVYQGKLNEQQQDEVLSLVHPPQE